MIAVAFRDALRDNDIAKVQQIIEWCNHHSPELHYSFLVDAINSGYQEIVIDLLEKGNYNVNERDFNGGTLLHSAVLQLCKSLENWTNVVVKMVEKGFYFGSQDEDGNTPIHLAFLNNASGEVLDFLLNLSVKVFREDSSQESFEQTYEKRALKGSNVNKDGLSIYHIACTRPNLDILKTLAFHGFAVRNYQVPLSSKCVYAGYTNLHFAVANRQYEVVKVLLAGKTNVYMTDKNDSTPFHFALQNGDSEMIELLLPSCKANSDMADKLGYTHFMAACASKEMQFVAKYLQAAAIKFPALLARTIKQQVNSVAGLPFAGFTPLHFAVAGGNREVVKILLKYGADFHAQDFNGTTPLHLALYIREKSMIQCILYNDNILEDIVDVFGISHFMAACAAAEPVIVKEFLRVAEIRLDSSQETLINAKVNANDILYAGYTPLHFAVEFGNYEVVKLLLDRGADLCAQDVKGSTPLNLALANSDTMTINLILQNDRNADRN